MDGRNFDMKPVIEAFENLNGCLAMDAFARDKVPVPDRVQLLSEAKTELQHYGIDVESDGLHAVVFMGNSRIFGNRMYEVTQDAQGIKTDCKVYRTSHE